MYHVAGLILLLTWFLYFFFLHDPAIKQIVYVAWVILGIGLVLIFWSIAVLLSRGEPERRDGWTQTTALVTTGIYAVVRHPLYLGWALMYISVMLFSQHWIIFLLGLLGIGCMCWITKQEDQHLIERFGTAYENYIHSVPSMNIFSGIIRFLTTSK